MHYVGIPTYQFILYSASATHKHSHTRILKPFEDSEQTGLKVDIALVGNVTVQYGSRGTENVIAIPPKAVMPKG